MAKRKVSRGPPDRNDPFVLVRRRLQRRQLWDRWIARTERLLRSDVHPGTSWVADADVALRVCEVIRQYFTDIIYGLVSSEVDTRFRRLSKAIETVSDDERVWIADGHVRSVLGRSRHAWTVFGTTAGQILIDELAAVDERFRIWLGRLDEVEALLDRYDPEPPRHRPRKGEVRRLNEVGILAELCAVNGALDMSARMADEGKTIRIAAKTIRSALAREIRRRCSARKKK